MGSKKGRIKGLSSIKWQSGTERTYYISWTGVKGKNLKNTHVDHYEVQWSWKNAVNKPWFDQSPSSVSAVAKNSSYTSTYNADPNACKLRVRVRPVSKTHKTKDAKGKTKTSTYFTGAYSKWHSISILTATDTLMGTINTEADISIALAGSSTSTVKATWQWPIIDLFLNPYNEDDPHRYANDRIVLAANFVAGYEYEWEYSVDDLADGIDWLSGSSGDVTSKAVTYSVPADATYIRFRMRGIAASNAKGLAYWDATWSGWETVKVSSLKPNIPKKKAITSVKLGLQNGTSDTLYAAWSWSADNTENYEFEWQYATSNSKKPIWFEGTTGSAELKNTTYQFPANAKQIRFRVKAIAENVSTGNDSIAYWTSGYSKWTLLKTSSLEPEIPSIDSIDNITFSSINDSTIRATWIWKQSNTKEYQYRWSYSTETSGNIWYEPTTGTATVANATYNVPANAKRIRFRVKAVSTTHTVNGQEVDRWTSGWTDWLVATVASFSPNVGKAAKISDARIDLQDGTASTLYATWSWNTTTNKNTDHYEVQWFYYTGDQDSDGSKHWFDPNDGTPVSVNAKEALYQVPSNALEVKFRVKAVSKSRTVLGKDYPYWTAPWSDPIVVAMSVFEPKVPLVDPISSITIGQQAGTVDTLYAVWTWTRTHTDHYEYEWQYKTADDIWFDGGSGSTSSGEIKNCTYQLPANATDVRVRVMAVSGTYTHIDTKEYEYWTADFSGYVTFSRTQLAPKVPAVPTVSMDGLKLTAEVDVYDSTATYIEFQIVANDTKLFNTGKANISYNHASYTYTVAAGNDYKVRARGCTDKATSEWSEYSSRIGTIPSTIGDLTYKKALSPTSMRIGWNEVPNAEEYNIEYAIDPDYFDASGEVKSMTVISSYAILTGLDTGVTWYVRARASNSNGQSGWSKPVSLILGRVPSPPTTWSETTTAIVGSDVILYWVHNAEDDSRQTEAILELTIGGNTSTIELDMSSEEETAVDQISSYTFDTSGYAEGASLRWRVKTRGIMDEFSDWSIERVVDIYAMPTLVMGLTDPNGPVYDILTAYPLHVSLEAGPNTQNAIGYSISIIAGESYESLGNLGNPIYILQGSTVYSRFIASDTENPNLLETEITAGDTNLEGGVSYTIICTASFDSGLTSEAVQDILVDWEEDDELYDLEPDAEITVDDENACCYIRPYCTDEEDEPVPNVTLAVYRIDFDGKLVEIMKDIPNDMSMTIMDPHPALDYARYRIIGSSNATGRTFYYDTPAMPMGINSIILQWGEGVVVNEDDDGYFTAPPINGTILRLPYNIDVQDSYAQDVNLVKYIGREYPVSYYGTQLGSTSEWSTDVSKFDTDTLYALRCLAIYRGDVYVREPSGSGYWAQVNVSFDRSHDSTVVPVSLSITRVEGGA